jgi:phage-related protein
VGKPTLREAPAASNGKLLFVQTWLLVGIGYRQSADNGLNPNLNSYKIIFVTNVPLTIALL